MKNAEKWEKCSKMPQNWTKFGSKTGLKLGFWVKIGEKLEKKEKKTGIWVNKLKILGKHSRKWDKASNSGKIWVKKLVKFAGFWSKTVKKRV